MSKYCFIIPNYNHHQQIQEVVAALGAFNLPIIMVNDASNQTTRTVLEALEQETPRLKLVHHQRNQGKGGAVQTGLKVAHELGFTHALQIDADGQHNLADIAPMLALSEANPQAVISGAPEFDDSIPKHRFISRYITHFWVTIETLSFALKDTMCGFRVYPLAPCNALQKKVSLGKRMDFDIEILVRLYWQQTPIIFKSTKVTYPEDGASHFKLFRDNLLISWMHTRLFFGMLLRIPSLLRRKFPL
ncbi:glycosyltransferase family 2 protein [Alteromonas sp. 14N.309.X.WAT.G.H12]|uniref:glycosyltransferase family 2 protein n=1 Tax=Alteromonas sp. 14N.309.X.WAT.G.H12 TaxID=3120824 RepID=UPI002FD2EE3C